MAASGPIIVVEDDPDDQEMIMRIFSKLKVENQVQVFSDGEKVLHYLRTTDENPLMIICDINMPLVNGIQLKEQIDKDHDSRLRTIPFIFLSTTANPEQVRHVYKLCTHGFFVKGQNYDTLKASIHRIVEYWKECIHPNNL